MLVGMRSASSYAQRVGVMLPSETRDIEVGGHALKPTFRLQVLALYDGWPMICYWSRYASCGAANADAGCISRASFPINSVLVLGLASEDQESVSRARTRGANFVRKGFTGGAALIRRLMSSRTDVSCVWSTMAL